MRVLWTGTFDPEFSRNKKLARLMSLSAVHWRVVRENVWASDRVALASRPSLIVALRALIGYAKLLVRLLIAPAPDVYLVSYPGWFDVPVVRLVASVKRRPLLFDPFLSLFDTMISDRGLRTGKSCGRASGRRDRSMVIAARRRGDRRHRASARLLWADRQTPERGIGDRRRGRR